MINPAMFGLSPQQMEAGKEVGKHLKMEVTKYPKEGRLEIRYMLIDASENFDVGQAINQLADQLIWGHYTFFDMKGKVIDVD
jgi:hypothetical protein